MTVIESGSAVNVEYTRRTRARSRSTRPDTPPLRTSTPRTRVEPPLDQDARRQRSATTSRSRRKSGSAASRAGSSASLIHIVGAMAAELVFYGENSDGVGGDLHRPPGTRRRWPAARACRRHRSTSTARRSPTKPRSRRAARDPARFEDIGIRLHRTAAAATDSRSTTRASRPFAAQFIGEAFVTAYNLMLDNKDEVERSPTPSSEKKEIYGDDLVRAARRPELRRARDRLDEGRVVAEDRDLVEGRTGTRRTTSARGRGRAGQ